jgi:hypothetical protein
MNHKASTNSTHVDTESDPTIRSSVKRSFPDHEDDTDDALPHAAPNPASSAEHDGSVFSFLLDHSGGRMSWRFGSFFPTDLSIRQAAAQANLDLNFPLPDDGEPVLAKVGCVV